MGALGELVGEGDGLRILAADLDLLYPLAVHEHVMVTCALVREHRCYAAARKPGLHVHACPVVAHGGPPRRGRPRPVAPGSPQGLWPCPPRQLCQLAGRDRRGHLAACQKIKKAIIKKVVPPPRFTS